MFIQKRKRVVGIGIMLVLTTFVGMTTNVSATGEPPIADAGGPYTGAECNSMLLNASGSYDPDGDPLTYRWNIDGSWYDNANNPFLEWIWLDDFSGVVTLEVSDGDLTAVDTAEVAVLNVPPMILNVTGPTEVDVGVEMLLLVNFFDGLPDPRGMIASLDTYTATFFWGDGSSTEFSLGVNEFNVSGTHVYNEAGVYQIIITIVDDNGGEASAIWEITVDGVLALVEAGPDGIIDEGSMFISAGFLADDSGTYIAMVDYGDETGAQELLLNPGNTFDLQHLYCDNGVYTILVTVFNEGEEWGSDSAMVMVNNVAPTASLGNDGPKDEGAIVTVSFSDHYDPGTSDTFTYSFNWNNDGIYEIVDQVGVSAQYTWYDNGVYIVKAKIKDDDGGFTEYTTDVTVTNVNPTATVSNDGPVAEGSPVTVLFSGKSDPGTSDTFTYSFDWNNDGTYEIVNQVGASAQYTWYDNGVYTVKAKIKDNDGGYTVYTTEVIVNNVPPSIKSMTGPPTDPIHIGNAIYLLGVFTDPGVLDSHIALIQWGDAQTTAVDLPAGVYQVNRSHTYASIGVYTITLTITDDDGGSDTKSIETYVVIYDPNCGFVTGGGWGIIPAGSYPANPNLGGRVNFGFVAKYKKGQITPEGNTEFQFQVGDMNFHSHIYEWLIIIGPKATYQGNGTINGQGHYGFRFTVIDGKIYGGGFVDKFRMKIWDKDNNNQIIFDNNMGVPDNQNPLTPLSGGQITIHNK